MFGNSFIDGLSASYGLSRGAADNHANSKDMEQFVSYLKGQLSQERERSRQPGTIRGAGFLQNSPSNNSIVRQSALTAQAAQKTSEAIAKNTRDMLNRAAADQVNMTLLSAGAKGGKKVMDMADQISNS